MNANNLFRYLERLNEEGVDLHHVDIVARSTTYDNEGRGATEDHYPEHAFLETSGELVLK